MAENGVPGRGPARRGINARGELWLDEGTRLRRIDPLTGTMAAERPTPRSAQVCGAAIIAAGQRLSWQGDTVTLRAFDAAAGAAGRRVVVHRPGWVADAAVWMNEGRVAVRWLNPRAEPQAQGSDEGQVYVDAGGGHFVPDGKPAPGRASNGHVEIEAEGGESGSAFWPDDDAVSGAWRERTAAYFSDRGRLFQADRGRQN